MAELYSELSGRARGLTLPSESGLSPSADTLPEMVSKVGSRISQARNERGWSQSELARRSGVTRAAISQIELGITRGLKASNLLSIARALGVSADWLQSGRGPQSLANASPNELPAVYEQSLEYELVTRVRGAILSAGSGHVSFEHEEVDNSHAFKREWMRRHGLKADRCRIMEIEGDSMQPFLMPGDVVLVNLDDPRIKSGEIYALAVEDELRIKRLYRRADGTLEIRSDNPSPLYKTEEIAPDRLESVRIIGRVVWRGGNTL